MQLHGGQRLYSATDLVGFLSCEHLTGLAWQALADRALASRQVENDASSALIAQKGNAHEHAYLRALPDAGRQVVVIATDVPLLQRKQQTLEAMASGAEVIYQATLLSGPWIGHADFLRRVDGQPSALGDYRYEVADTKLARSPKAKFLVQLAFYSQLVAKVQIAEPQLMHVALGDGSEPAFRCADFMHYFAALQVRYTFRTAPAIVCAGGQGFEALQIHGARRSEPTVPLERCAPRGGQHPRPGAAAKPGAARDRPEHGHRHRNDGRQGQERRQPEPERQNDRTVSVAPRPIAASIDRLIMRRRGTGPSAISATRHINAMCAMKQIATMAPSLSQIPTLGHLAGAGHWVWAPQAAGGQWM